MNVLLLGGGGREHAIAWKLHHSPLLKQLFIAPGNPGTAALGTNHALDVQNPEAVVAFARKHQVDLVVVGPEAPLVAGVVDACRAAGIAAVGPTQAAAQLEGSKLFSKAFMQRHGIPTARYGAFMAEQIAAAVEFTRSMRPPYVIKADGLAAGKGVVICQTLEECEDCIRAMLERKEYGAAGERIVVEEFLDGVEVSCFALCDGSDYVMLPSAKDYKRVGEGDTGPNTGGMGSVSPVWFADDALRQRVEERIVQPTLRGMDAEGCPFTGFLFLGLMVSHGEPYLLEYNVRLGDPETQSVLPRIESDFLALLHASATGQLGGQSVRISPQTAVTVVCVSGGYPGHYESGFAIDNLDQVDGSLVFHAGTKTHQGRLVTAGGRVLAVTTLGDSLEEARTHSLHNAGVIDFRGKHFRSDIAADLLVEE